VPPMNEVVGDVLPSGAKVAILGAGPAGCLFAIALLDGARARRRPIYVTLYDGGAILGRTREPVLVDATALSRLAAAGIPLPAASCVPLDGVRGVFGEIEARAPGAVFVSPRGDHSEGDLGAFLRATAISRGARLLPRAADGVFSTPEGTWVIRAAGATEKADVVMLALGAGSPLAASLEDHVPPPVFRSCAAVLEADPETRAGLGSSALALPGREGLPDLWVLPDAHGAQVVALGPDVTAAQLAEALLAAVAAGTLPGRFSLRAPRRRVIPDGAARPGLPAIGDALGGAPGLPGLGAAAAQARQFAAALLDGGEVALRAACRKEARALGRAARIRRRRRRRWARLPDPVVARAVAREAEAPPSRRPVERALSAAVDPRAGAMRLPGLLRVLLALFVAAMAVLAGKLSRRRPRPAPLPGGPVFVIDDDPEQSALVCHFLDGRGVPCRAFEDGIAAAASALREKPAAILLDVALPWLDGPGICRVLKRSRHTRDVPVILATALPPAMARREGALAGAQDVLVKPLDLEGLVKRLAPYLPPPRPPAAERLPRAGGRGF
jgi:CheY-like chemotaxis protein/flavin-dependent dehydrogenase